MKKIGKIGLLLVCIALYCAGPAMAAITTISQGNAVFIGEQGLDVTPAMGGDTRIGWWASGADISRSAPTKTLDLSTTTTGFFASPAEFSGYTGNWYRLDAAGKADGIAFSIVDPQLSLKVEDITTSVDVEALKWIPTGDDIRFRIETNLVQITSQRLAPLLITIKVQSPDGALYTSLADAAGTPTSIVNIPVTTSPFYTGSIWNMGNPDRYPPGTYTLWAECNANGMKDNYEVTGKTVSSRFSLLNQDQNPLIRLVTTRMTTLPTPRITTVAPTRTTVTTPVPATTAVTTTIPVPATTTPAPLPSPTAAPGFEAVPAGAALLGALVFLLKKE